MRILVAGGAGYIGNHTCVELLNAGHKVAVADNLVNASAEALKRVEQITGERIPFYRADIRDREKMADILRRECIDGVINFAGLKAVGESVHKPLEYYDNNIGGMVTLCEAMGECGVKNLIFSSSATVYGDPAEMPITEECPRGKTTNPYGRTKAMLEDILTDLHTADGEWNIVLLRYFNPIGAHESGLIGEDPKGIPNNLVPYIAQVAVGRLDHLKVYGNDYPTVDGTGVRDYIHVVDLAKGHVAAMEYAMHHTGTEIFNLGTGKGVSVTELVETFEQVNGVAVPHVYVGRRAGDLAEYYANADKARRVLGWQAERSIADMCRDSWNWQKNNPNGYSNEKPL